MHMQSEPPYVTTYRKRRPSKTPQTFESKPYGRNLLYTTKSSHFWWWLLKALFFECLCI